MISVIIPVYNGAKFLSNILLDLSLQKHKDFEAIFVDDGSSDNSYDLLLEYKESSNYTFPIIVIRQSNKGVSGARNTGIKHAKGSYFCFVDVDDGIVPEYLSYMYSIIRAKNASIVFCKATNDYSDHNNKKEIIKSFSRDESLIRFLNFDLISGVWSLMVDSKLINENNLQFAEGFRYSEDLHMIWRLIYYSNLIVETNKQLYVYKINEGSAMGKFDGHRMDSLKLMEDLELFFKVNSPEFSLAFNQFGKARMAWSLVWQAAYHCSYSDFLDYIKSYDFKTLLRNLFAFKQKHVALSSMLFCTSPRLYYSIARIASRKFRSS